MGVTLSAPLPFSVTECKTAAAHSGVCSTAVVQHMFLYAVYGAFHIAETYCSTRTIGDTFLQCADVG